MRPRMGVLGAEKGRDGVPEEGPAQMADEEHPHAAVFIGARRSIAANEPIDEVVEPIGILHVETQQLTGRREM